MSGGMASGRRGATAYSSGGSLPMPKASSIVEQAPSASGAASTAPSTARRVRGNLARIVRYTFQSSRRAGPADKHRVDQDRHDPQDDGGVRDVEHIPRIAE